MVAPLLSFLLFFYFSKFHKSVINLSRESQVGAAKPNRLRSADRAGWEKKKKREKKEIGGQERLWRLLLPLKSEALLRVGTLLGR